MTKTSPLRKNRHSKKNGKMSTARPFQCTDDERLRVENLSLRLELIQKDANEKAAPVLLERRMLLNKIGERLGIDISQHQVDLQSGRVSPIQPPQLQEVAEDGEAQSGS